MHCLKKIKLLPIVICFCAVRVSLINGYALVIHRFMCLFLVSFLFIVERCALSVILFVVVAWAARTERLEVGAIMRRQSATIIVRLFVVIYVAIIRCR
jgi:hypothetical protein